MEHEICPICHENNDNQISKDEIKFFLGYSGWSKKQLYNERKHILNISRARIQKLIQAGNIILNKSNLCRDNLSNKPNHEDFIQNRHDQSVWSLIGEKYNKTKIAPELAPLIQSRV